MRLVCAALAFALFMPLAWAQPAPVVGKPITTKSGLQYWQLKAGSGAVAAKGDIVHVHYTGWLTDGSKFDSSLTRGEPLRFWLGKGQVIAGWDEGVAGMKVGEKRQLHIPAKLGYGASGTNGIPPNSELIFDVELVSVDK